MNALAQTLGTSGDTMWSDWCIKGTLESTRTRKEILSWLLDVNRGQSIEHGKSDLGCFMAPLVAIFGYGGENIGENLLEKIRIISLARSSGTEL
jgi:hypothetical protein